MIKINTRSILYDVIILYSYFHPNTLGHHQGIQIS